MAYDYGYGQYQQGAAYPYPDYGPPGASEGTYGAGYGAYGQSAASFGTGQSQTFLTTGGEYYSSSRAEQRERSNHSFVTVALLTMCCVLILVICTGVLLVFRIDEGASPTEREEGSPTLKDLPVRVEIGPGDPGQTADTEPFTTEDLSTETTQQSHTPMGTPPSVPTISTVRTGMTFCVVGDGLTSGELFNNNLCDYIVYPDLVAKGGEFVPLLGKASWSVFQSGTTDHSQTRRGLSFTAVGVGQAGSTLDSLPNMAAQLASFVQTMNVTAMGVLNFPRHLVTSATILEPAFEALARAVSQHRTHGLPMIFLGVWLYKKDTARHFASELSTMAHVTTVIIQTHISVPFVTGRTLCISRPVSSMAATDITPSFEVAQEAESVLRSLGYKYRIIFSSTLGVMVYVGTTVRGEPSGPNQGCDLSYMADVDFVCSGGVTSSGLQTYDNAEMYAYIVYKDGNNQHFVAYETTTSLLEKMHLYIEKISDGWAFFEAHRDRGKECSVRERFERLKLTWFTARHRVRGQIPVMRE